MRQFLAILKDSYHEAVDGFVIYAMLGLTAVVLLLLFSLTFEPAPAAEVVTELAPRFAAYAPDRGTAPQVAFALIPFKATDIKADRGDVSFRLVVPPGEAFRRAVAGWLKPPAGPGQKVTFQGGPRGKQKGAPPDEEPNDLGLAIIKDQTEKVTAEEAAAVTDDQMAAFVVSQVELHLGAWGSAASRVSGTEYEFDVRVPGATTSRGWPQDLSLFFGGWKFGRYPLGSAVAEIENTIVNGFGAGFALLIGVVITAFFIPNMLRKGALDLLISKPISRTRLLVFKYVGGLTFVFLLSVAAVGGAWAVIGLRSGHWDPRFLMAVPVLTFTFAVLYAVSTLMAVLTRSAVAAILVTLGFAFCLYLTGQFKTIADLKRNTGLPIMGTWPDWMYTFADTLNTVLPRTKDLDKLISKATMEGSQTPIALRAVAGQLEYPSWSGAVGLSLAYIAALLALACWRFNKRDS